MLDINRINMEINAIVERVHGSYEPIILKLTREISNSNMNVQRLEEQVKVLESQKADLEVQIQHLSEASNGATFGEEPVEEEVED